MWFWFVSDFVCLISVTLVVGGFGMSFVCCVLRFGCCWLGVDVLLLVLVFVVGFYLLVFC